MNRIAFAIVALICATGLRFFTVYGPWGRPDMAPMLFASAISRGDVYQTNADTSRLESEIGHKPKVRLHEGLQEFARWYNSPKNPLKD